MSFSVRAGQFFVAFVSALALVVGSTQFFGARFWLFSAGVIAAAAWSIYVLYKRTSQRWLRESYELLAEARLSELRPRVEAELTRPRSGIHRAIVEQLWGETLFWSGEFERAYETAVGINTERLSVPWRGAVFGLRVTSSLFSGHVQRAREILEENHAVLEQRPGLHHLEALIALKSGDAKAARQLYTRIEESWERPKLVRAALALIEGQIAVELGENPDEKLKLAQELGGESWVVRAARDHAQALTR